MKQENSVRLLGNENGAVGAKCTHSLMLGLRDRTECVWGMGRAEEFMEHTCSLQKLYAYPGHDIHGRNIHNRMVIMGKKSAVQHGQPV